MMKHDYSNIIAQEMKEIIDSKEHRSLFSKNIKTASNKCVNCNEDQDRCMCGDGGMYADTPSETCLICSGDGCDHCSGTGMVYESLGKAVTDEPYLPPGHQRTSQDEEQGAYIGDEDEHRQRAYHKDHAKHHGHRGHRDRNHRNDSDHRGHNDAIDEILTEASIASAVESLVKASATLERLGFKTGATEALAIASIVVEAKKKKDNKKKMNMKMKMMREKMMKDKKDSSSKSSKSDSSKSNSSSSMPEFLKKKIKFAQYVGGGLQQSHQGASYHDNHPNVAPPPYSVANPGPIPGISNPSYPNTMYPAAPAAAAAAAAAINNKSKSQIEYVKDLDKGTQYLINKLGPTSTPKISGQDRQKYLNQLNTIIKEINRVYLKSGDTAMNMIAPLVGTIQSSFSGEDASKMNDFSKLSGMIGSSLQPASQVSNKDVEQLEEYAQNIKNLK